MRLKKLEVHGFKSFADRIVIYFDEGITAIVGPNGCGKSNISDAFRWVLGEQSAKSLRGGKMGDVIFAGTATRKPLNYAEVTLTLTDVGGKLPVEYEEVSVSRRLHRSGESEYLINRHPVRLRDVQSLFLDSGVGKNAFSIFEQGKIDQVINLGPMDRRYIFEEAAGILRFLQRKREALRKLEHADQNMTRVTDIYREVEERIKVLEEQAEKARTFKANQAELDRLEKVVFLTKWELLKERLEQGQQEDEGLAHQLEEGGKTVEDLERQLAELKEELLTTEKTFQERSEQVYKARSQREIQVKEKLSRKERIKESAIKQKQYQQELKELKNKREGERVAFEHSKKRQHGVDKDLMVLDEALQSARQKVKKGETQLVALRQRHHEAQKERFDAVQEESRSSTELEQNKVRLDHASQRAEELKERKSAGSEKLKTLKKEAQERKAAVDQVATQVDKQRDRLSAVDQSLSDLDNELAERTKERELLAEEISESRARHKALLRIKEEMDGFSSGTKLLVREVQDPKSPLHNKLTLLSELLKPQQGYELAIAAVMRPYTQTLVAETKADFEKVIKFAQEQEITDFSLVCLASLKGKGDGSGKAVMTLLEHVSDHALARHFLGAVSVTQKGRDDEWEVVTREGEWRDSKGVLFFTSKGANNAFLREAEIRTLEKRVAEIEKGQRALEKVTEQLQHRKMQLQAERKDVDQSIRKSEMKLVETNFGLQSVLADLKEREEEFGAVDSELVALQDSVKQFKEAIKEQETRHQESRKRHTALEKELTKLEEELEKVTACLDEDKTHLAETEASHRKAFEEHQKLLHALKVFTIKEEEGMERQERLERELEELMQAQEKWRFEEEQTGTDIGEVEKELTEAEKERKQLEKSVTQGRKTLDQVAKQIQSAQNKVKDFEKAKYQVGIKLAQAGSQREAIEEELRQRFHLEIVDLQGMSLKLDVELGEAEKRIRALRRDIEKAGDVNMTSIEEFGRQKERYQTLGQQMGDLDSSKQELLDIVAELDAQSRQLFADTFEIIRTNFQKNFKILFNGGEADLKFTESKDVLEAGIEIIAKPPGKQMRSINLLSGGEKCLTAISLLFAIFEVKSAPFCILDEIDAPLDDSNIDRFVNVVKQFIDRSQFIIITHNKRTMAIADKLFGVSMQEKGVSKVLSMSFTPETEKAEELVSMEHTQ